MAPKGGAVDLPIILSTGGKKCDPDTRKLIRSHVMLGKNRGKSRRAKCDDVKVVPPKGRHAVQEKQSSSPTEPFGCIPMKVGSEASLVPFADNVDPSLAVDILKFTAISKSVMFRLEMCTMFHKKKGLWYDLLMLDAAYLHTMAFVAEDFFGRILTLHPSRANPPTSVHFLKTLRLLRERLSYGAEEVKTSDATIMIILFLSTHAHITGDLESAMHHLKGLHRIVTLRGGIIDFTDDLKLKSEIFRCDLSIALHNSTTPLFFHDPLGLTVPCPPSAESDNERFLCKIDNNLARVWSVMKRFSQLINFAAETNQKLPMETLVDTMASVMYRLLNMRFEKDTIAEAVRLGLLGFSSSVFLQWQNIKQAYLRLADTYKECLVNLKSLNGVSSHIMLWLLMVGATSIFTDSDKEWLESWLRVNLQLCRVASWPSFRKIMASYMWIGMVHDQPGEEIFNSVTSSRALESRSAI
ncbi:hypothetical protein BDV25DRAFT_156084 [Aspergillus avenaceus]|uniref:Fungal-specific transcription factor domain-containing protein n=1 Tax=Aspergillus avenaceus TaxID=36643 RepID=A0A5N6TTG2_ASPAV|nr:hypothetical protein BDV25DRAFT_156084 [Aspergillus avenaceus]